MDLIYSNESFAIRGAVMKVYNTLGCGFLEAVYQEVLAIELEKRNIPFEREKNCRFFMKGTFTKEIFC